jgi:hypothetical protein
MAKLDHPKYNIIKPGPGMSGKPLDSLVSLNANNSAASGPGMQNV